MGFNVLGWLLAVGFSGFSLFEPLATSGDLGDLPSHVPATGLC